MQPFNFATVWEATLAQFRAQRSVLIPVGAAFLFLPQLVFGRVLGDSTPAEWFEGPGTLQAVLVLGLVLATSIIGQLSIAAIALGSFGTGTVGDTLKEAASRLPPALAGSLIQGIAFGFGLILLIVPGLYMLGRLWLVIPLIVAETRDPLDAIRRSWELTRGRGLQIMGFAALLLLGVLLLTLAAGGLASGLGALLALAIGTPEEGWGVSRWLVELVRTAVSAGLGLMLALFVAELYRALKVAP
ncbi:MAG: hypothetical protein ACK4TG_10515, partial [Thermaurantiacus sp.]